MNTFSQFDVVICGAGLAGLTLARQIKLEIPELSIAVLDRLVRPLPKAAFKVGESSVELGTHYFGKVLQLQEYFEENHLFKLGLRFFMGFSHGPIEDRPEMGISIFPPHPSYQIDRGVLENDLRGMIEEMGITLFEGVTVEEISLAEGDAPHHVTFTNKQDRTSRTLRCRWVIDALGRRRFPQSKLGLKREVGHKASAAWWRYEGRVDVDDLAVSEHAQSWRESIIDQRYFSTNHLTDRGYWVWLIPLGSGATSLGIVADEKFHPLNTYGQSYESGLEWLGRYEPVLWNYLKDREPLDFHSLKHFSYTSTRVFSENRWSCVGEAGIFLDPLYSPGSDFIAITNTITVELIRREIAGELTKETVDEFNHLLLDVLFPIGLAYYEGTYTTLGHPQIFTTKLTWDTAVNWAFIYPLFFQGLLKSPPMEIFAFGKRFHALNLRMQQFFVDWAEKAPPRKMPARGDMTRMPILQLLHSEMSTLRDTGQVLDAMQKNLDSLEEIAQVLFWQAVEECHPGHPALANRPWINSWRISLDPELWQEQGLFDPETPPRSLRTMRRTFSGIFAPRNLRETWRYDLFYSIIHWNKGFVFKKIMLPFLDRYMAGKPGMWLRRVFL